MPDWVMYLLFGVAALALVWWFLQSKATKLPSGNAVAGADVAGSTVNASGTQYGNLT